MNQIHPKSQTTQILYREPTQEEMSPKSNLFWNFCSTLLISILIGFTVYVAFIAADKEAVIKTEKQAQVRAEVVK